MGQSPAGAQWASMVDVIRRKQRFIAGSLAIATVVAGGSVAWAACPAGSGGSSGPTSDVGVAGPLGPQAITAFPSYFKRVTFAADELGQAQEIAAHLPVGRYLVQVIAPHAPDGSSPDCMGVSFPLAPPAGPGDEGKAFTGYVSVAKDGDTATVSCYLPAAGTHSSATYEVFYVPALSVTG